MKKFLLDKVRDFLRPQHGDVIVYRPQLRQYDCWIPCVLDGIDERDRGPGERRFVLGYERQYKVQWNLNCENLLDAIEATRTEDEEYDEYIHFIGKNGRDRHLIDDMWIDLAVAKRPILAGGPAVLLMVGMAVGDGLLWVGRKLKGLGGGK